MANSEGEKCVCSMFSILTFKNTPWYTHVVKLDSVNSLIHSKRARATVEGSISPRFMSESSHLPKFKRKNILFPFLIMSLPLKFNLNSGGVMILRLATTALTLVFRLEQNFQLMQKCNFSKKHNASIFRWVWNETHQDDTIVSLLHPVG